MAGHHLFLSYSSDDIELVSQLREDFIASGELVWWDQDIKPGEDWRSAISKALSDSYAVVVCFSQSAYSRGTSGVRPEIADAIALYQLKHGAKTILLPVRLNDCHIPELEVEPGRLLSDLRIVDLFPASRRAYGLSTLKEALRARPRSRPQIPADVRRQVLIESGHRCAVCGEAAALGQAHIIPWSQSKDHSIENLIALCANCHERADIEKWGAESLRQYKSRPWILRSQLSGIQPAPAGEGAIERAIQNVGPVNESLNLATSPANAPHENASSIKLSRIRACNFRGIAKLDVTIESYHNVICFVGPNGSGKSSVLSWLSECLCRLTHEDAPDRSTATASDAHAAVPGMRTTSANEIGHSGSGSLVRMDWSFGSTESSFIAAACHPQETRPVHDVFAADVTERDVTFGHEGWTTRPAKANDPVARNVLLLRPADRCELASYEEPPNLTVAPGLLNDSHDVRPFPIRVKSLGLRLEQLLFDMELDAHNDVTTASWFLSRWSRVFQGLTGASWSRQLGMWPFRRYGPMRLGRMSLLSAGELDVLVTAASILSQQMALFNRFPSIDWDWELGPSGFVFIDEVDTHLHPQWQGKVLPLLTKVFPNITFVITTHSPFVLQSLPANTSTVVRLPDGEQFESDFSAWNIEEILSTVFEVSPRWTKGITARLRALREACADPERIGEAASTYASLWEQGGSGLQAECQKTVTLYGCAEFLETIVETD